MNSADPIKWLRAQARDPHSPTKLFGKNPLAPLTGQDFAALVAIGRTWDLFATADEGGRQGALEAVRLLLTCVQPSCQYLARELIAYALDWDDRDRLWPSVVAPRRKALTERVEHLEREVERLSRSKADHFGGRLP